MLGGIKARRGNNDRFLVSILLEPGGTHYAWSETQAEYAAKFIEEVAKLRIPAFDVNQETPVDCIVIAPESGALSDTDLHEPKFAAAWYKDYQGDPKTAQWHPSLELAELNETFHKDLGLDKKPQFVTFRNPFNTSQVMYPGHDLRLRMGNPTWASADTIIVDGQFLNRPTVKYPAVEGEVGHSDTPIKFRNFGGAIEQVAPNKFRVALDGRSSLRSINILIYNDGDDVYRHCQQQGRMDLPDALKDGADNAVTFSFEHTQYGMTSHTAGRNTVARRRTAAALNMTQNGHA